eukprot:TRINITY_DN20343_c0_g1_i1.p1 TRINITY_DN20343_c0_g1~~TRINITY_DN20343_c0_g1_i1.p1  ORF type:complete len:661 (+),score=204.26 TRINITY_DN20343_c0_g1_i1:103-2085(+)
MEDLLPPDKIRELRKVVDHHLRAGNVYNQVREVLAEFTAREGGEPTCDALLGLVQEKGLIQRIVNDSVDPFQLGTGRGARLASSRVQTDGAARYLHVRLMGGRAFLEHLDTDPVATTFVNQAARPREQLFACLQFGGQRFKSAGADCVCDPDLDDSFLVNLDEELARKGVNQLARHAQGRDLLRLNTPLQVVLVRHDPVRKVNRYVGENKIEWRSVLKSGVVNLSVELGGGGQGLKVPVGVLELQLELLPVQPNLSDDEITSHINAERNALTAAEREFLVFARRWWQEYHAVSPQFQQRYVKVFATLQSPTNSTTPVTAFVTPLPPSRFMPSPLLSARFVALLSYDRDDDRATSGNGVAGTAAPDSWVDPFTFLTLGKGNAHEHANLLCSLLLGHGLDAWVALGVDTQNNHATCVLTKSSVTGTVVFWDVLTGSRYHAAGPLDAAVNTYVPQWYGLTRIHCCYTSNSLVANVQADDGIATTSYEFDDERAWKAMNPIKLKLITSLPAPTILSPHLSSHDLPHLEESLEKTLMEGVADYRERIALPTVWDTATLPRVLGQALWNYELQQATNIVVEASMFQSAVRSTIQTGQNFTAFPVHFAHQSPSRMLAHFTSSKHTKDIVELCKDEVRHAIRVKVTAYAEDAVSVWVLLAAVYRTGPA